MSIAPTFDPVSFKDATRRQWDRAAAGWNDHSPQIRGWLQESTQAMLDMAGVAPGQRVLDVAAGAGDQTLEIAARVGPHGAILATDISANILDFAQRNAFDAGYKNVETLIADGEMLDVDDASFDTAICRLGLMFFPNPLAALRNIHRALKPGGGFCAMVFSTPQANPCVSILMSTALAHARLTPRDPFSPGGLLSLGKPGLMDDLTRQAGFHDVATTKINAPFRLKSSAAYLDFVRTSASPIQQIMAALDDAARQEAWDEMEKKLEQFQTEDGWMGPNELLLTAGRR